VHHGQSLAATHEAAGFLAVFADVEISCYTRCATVVVPAMIPSEAVAAGNTGTTNLENIKTMSIVRIRMLLRTAIWLSLLVFITQPVWSQEQVPSVSHPRPKRAGAVDASLGLRVLAVPRDISEDELNRAPALDAQMVMGLPLQFTLLLATEIQFLTNQLKGGLRWSHCVGDFCLGVGDELAFWIGAVDFSGFDNSMRGWKHYPHLTLGYEFKNVLLSLRGESIYTLSERSFTGENELSSSKNRLRGYAGSLMLEQPLLHNMHVILGIRLSYADYHHQTWFAFSAIERRLLYSEFLFAVLL
jgi:hypothetical protein